MLDLRLYSSSLIFSHFYYYIWVKNGKQHQQRDSLDTKWSFACSLAGHRGNFIPEAFECFTSNRNQVGKAYSIF